MLGYDMANMQVVDEHFLALKDKGSTPDVVLVRKSYEVGFSPPLHALCAAAVCVLVRASYEVGSCVQGCSRGSSTAHSSY